MQLKVCAAHELKPIPGNLHTSELLSLDFQRTRVAWAWATRNIEVQSSWRSLWDEKRCRKEGFHGNDSWDVFPLDIDGYFYDSFSYDSTDILSWHTHLILAQWLNSLVTLFLHISYHTHDESNVLPYCHPFLLLWLLFLCCIIILPWLRYCAYWCASWLISDSFLTHIILLVEYSGNDIIITA